MIDTSALGIHDLPVFIAAGLLLNIAPGPDSLLISMRSATQGWRAGSVAALGVASGGLVHVTAATLGVSALIAASAAAFTALKLIGAAYLVYVGARLLCAVPAPASATFASDAVASGAPRANAALSLRRIYIQGFLTNATNPKVALFFLAFVPQFIASDAPAKSAAFVLLGLLFNINGLLWCVFLAWLVSHASRRLRLSARAALWFKRAIGGLFVALGVRLALARVR